MIDKHGCLVSILSSLSEPVKIDKADAEIKQLKDKPLRKTEGPPRAKGKPLPYEVVWIIEEGYFGYIGTSNNKKIPHVTPVIYVFDGDYIYFITIKKAKKIRNIEKNPKVAFLIDIRDPSNLLNNRATMIQGTVKKIGVVDAIIHLKRLLKIRSLFYKKYPKYMNSYSINKDKIPKSLRKTIFIRRTLLRIKIENFHYIRNSLQTPSRYRAEEHVEATVRT